MLFDQSTNSHFVKKVYSIDTDTISISGGSGIGGIPSGISSETFITLIDRPIGIISSQLGSQSLHWDSPPNEFIGNNLNYFMLTLKNEHLNQGSFISASVNGWHTDATSGD